MSDLVGNPQNRFSHDAVNLNNVTFVFTVHLYSFKPCTFSSQHLHKDFQLVYHMKGANVRLHLYRDGKAVG